MRPAKSNVNLSASASVSFTATTQSTLPQSSSAPSLSSNATPSFASNTPPTPSSPSAPSSPRITSKLRASNIAFYFLVVFVSMVIFSMLILLPALYGSQQHAAALRQQEKNVASHSESATSSTDYFFFGSPEPDYYEDNTRHSSDAEDFETEDPEWRASSLVRDLIRESDQKHRHENSDFPHILARGGGSGSGGSNRQNTGGSVNSPVPDMDLSDILSSDESQRLHDERSGASSHLSIPDKPIKSDVDDDRPNTHANQQEYTSSGVTNSQTAGDSNNPQSHRVTAPSWTRVRPHRADNVIYYGDNVLIEPDAETTETEAALSKTDAHSRHEPTTHLQASSAINDKKTKSTVAQHVYWIQKNGTVPLSDENFKCRNTVQGKIWITDSRGVMCEVFDVDPESMCCTERGLSDDEQDDHYAESSTFTASQSSSRKFNCGTCQQDTGCCQVFENCVSCCMKDLDRARHTYADLIESAKRENDEETFKLYHSVRTLFEFCQTRCRTNSKSVVNENKYRSTFKHCF